MYSPHRVRHASAETMGTDTAWQERCRCGLVEPRQENRRKSFGEEQVPHFAGQLTPRCRVFFRVSLGCAGRNLCTRRGGDRRRVDRRRISYTLITSVSSFTAAADFFNAASSSAVNLI